MVPPTHGCLLSPGEALFADELWCDTSLRADGLHARGYHLLMADLRSIDHVESILMASGLDKRYAPLNEQHLWKRSLTTPTLSSALQRAHTVPLRVRADIHEGNAQRGGDPVGGNLQHGCVRHL